MSRADLQKRLGLATIVALCPALAVVASVVISSWPAAAEDANWDRSFVKRPYIFTQQNNVANRPDVVGRVQQVRLGYPLQVQLPGNPAVWTFAAAESQLVEPRGRTMVYSADRIEDTHSIFVFDFTLAADARAGDSGIITLTTDEPPASLSNVVPGGVYAVAFLVIDPE